MRKIAYGPTGQKIEFDAKWHNYYVDGKKYTSVTTILKKLFPTFDREGISYRYAKKHGLLQEDVLKKWDAKGKAATLFGNRCHDYAEALFKGEDHIIAQSDKEKLYFPHINRCVEELLIKYKFLEAEKIVFSPKHKLSGTIDLILEEIATDRMVILDWKSIESLNFHNDYNEYGLYYLSHLYHCNYNHYAMQLNLYRRILKMENYYPDRDIGLGLIHFLPDGFKPYKINDMETEVDNVITLGVPSK